MRCEHCDGDELTVYATVSQKDGTIRRKRRCSTCQRTWGTVEVQADKFVKYREAWMQQTSPTPGGPVPGAVPLPSAPAHQLADLEAELEARLSKILLAVDDALAQGSNPGRDKLEFLRWFIQDRRAYRTSLIDLYQKQQQQQAIAADADLMAALSMVQLPNPVSK